VTAPLTPLECELLEAVVEQRESAQAVLGDYWIENVDPERGAFLHLHLGANRERIDLADEEARLAPIAHGWRTPLVAVGFAERDLVLSDGFLQWPLAFPMDHPLAGHPDIVRLSPRYYREVAAPTYGSEHVVYEAEAITPRTRTRVALKFPVWDEERVLDREMQHLARLAPLAHPNLPRLLGHAVRPATEGREANRGIVLAWAGRDLDALLRAARSAHRTLGPAFAISVAVQLLEAIAAIHQVGITHNEIRPDHVLLAADGTVTLIGYGYAHSDLAPAYALSSIRLRPKRIRFRYLAPEQARGHTIDERTDVFSAAGLISELVANQHPLPPADSDFETLQNILDTTQQAAPELPAAVRAPLQTALALQPEQRPSALVLRDALLAGARNARLAIGPHVIAQTLVELGVPA
jgi:serine/threonine protein kinase